MVLFNSKVPLFSHIHSQSCKLLRSTLGIHGCRNILDEEIRFAWLKPSEIPSQRAFLHGGDACGYSPKPLEFSSQEIRRRIRVIKAGKALGGHQAKVLSQHCQGHHGLISQKLFHSPTCWELFPGYREEKMDGEKTPPSPI